jgi:hypothetical protein
MHPLLNRRERPSGASAAASLALVAALGFALALATLTGCATREIKSSVYDRSGVKMFLREHKQGFQVMERGFQHPVQISPERLSNILGAIDIRGREAALAGIRAAFEPAQLETISEGLASSLSKASSNQEVGVSIIRKEMQHVIFDRKRLTSFVAYVQDDLLYLHFSRVDWEIPDRVKKTALPIPRVTEHPMKFRVEPTDGMFREGNYAVSVEWQDEIFRRPLRQIAEDDDRRERTILMEEPDLPNAPKKSFIPADLLPHLTPTQLRELADLEEARSQGRLTEGHYRRQRDEILQAAREESATSD